MHSDQVVLAVAVAVLVTALAAAAVVLVALGRRVRQLGVLVERLQAEVVPAAARARAAADHAAVELERVGDVLGSAEAVSATVDSASRLVYRVFANPAVKTVAYASGVNGALRRMFVRRSRVGR